MLQVAYEKIVAPIRQTYGHSIGNRWRSKERIVFTKSPRGFSSKFFEDREVRCKLSRRPKIIKNKG